MSDDEFDYEEEIDDEGAEYVYNRNQDRAAPVDLDKLVRPAAQGAPPPIAVPPVKEVAVCALPAALAHELDDLKSSTDVIVTQSKNGVQVSVAATSRAMNGAGLEIRFEVDDCYPRKRPTFDLLPPRGLKIRDVRHVGPLVEETIARLGGTPVVGKVVGVLRQWLNDESFRQQLEEAEARVLKAEADEEERKARALKEQEELEHQRQEAAKLPAWVPRTAAEDDQRIDTNVPTLCRVVTDLGLPRTGFLCAARVGGRVFFYGGLINATRYSDDLHILHIASRKVEVLCQPSVLWPPAMAHSAAVSVGKSVFLFGGLSLQRHGNYNSLTAIPSRDVWELNTVTLTWHSVAEAVPRYGCTATVLDNRRVLIFGGLSQSINVATPLNLLEVCESSLIYISTYSTATGVFPAARAGHTAVLWQDKLIIYAGRGYTLLDDVWVLDTKTWVWYGPLPTVDSGIPGRVHHSMCLVGGRLMIYGGQYSDGTELCDLLVYDILDRRFHHWPIAVATDARSGHVAILTGGTMLIVGGACAEVDRQLFALHEYHQSARVTMQWRAVTSVVALALSPAAIPVPASHLLQDLARLCNRSTADSYADLQVGPAGLCVHAFILQARCPSLVAAITAALAAAGGGKLEVPRLASPVAYRAFVDYIYTGNPMAQLEPEDLLCGAVREQLMACASHLSLDKLKERMQQQVSSQSRFYPEVMEDLACLVARPIRTDFTLIAGALRLPVNKVLLACRSEYFRAMLGAGMSESQKGELVLPAELSDVAARALHQFLYTDELDPTCAEHAMELVPFADMAQLSRLQRAAERLITDAFDMTDLDSVLALAMLAEECHSQALLARCLFLLVQHFGLTRATAAAGWAVLSRDVQVKARKLANEC